jgi:hypothetical protein
VFTKPERHRALPSSVAQHGICAALAESETQLQMEFWADMDASAGNQERIARLAPHNPFCDPRYVQWREGLGDRGILLGLANGKDIAIGCPAFVSSRYIVNRTLELPTVPDLPDACSFWNGLLQFCRRHWISYLVIDNYCGSSSELPVIESWTSSDRILEYRLSLTRDDLWGDLSDGHKWSIKKARKLGVQLRTKVAPDAFIQHAAMFSSSLERRAARGEVVTFAHDESYYRGTIECGLGQLFQAELNGSVVASQILFRAARGAYYFSAGTSPEGLKCGAAAFTLYEAMLQLREEGTELLNLGRGVTHEGLSRYKAGFGAVGVNVTRAGYFVGGPIRKMIARVRKRRGSSHSPPEEGPIA